MHHAACQGLALPQMLTERSHEQAQSANAIAIFRILRCTQDVFLARWLNFAGHSQGLVDYAMAPAGGRVIGHSQLYPRPDDPATTTWSQIGAALIPGAMPAVHPKANKVNFSPLAHIFPSSF